MTVESSTSKGVDSGSTTETEEDDCVTVTNLVMTEGVHAGASEETSGTMTEAEEEVSVIIGVLTL